MAGNSVHESDMGPCAAYERVCVAWRGIGVLSAKVAGRSEST